MSTIQIIGAVIFGIGVLGVLVMAVAKVRTAYLSQFESYPPTPAPAVLNRTASTPVTVPTSTDAPAPTGVSAYLGLIEGTTPSATFETRWEYAKKGLTEAQVLRAELGRLTLKPQVKPVAPAEVKP